MLNFTGNHAKFHGETTLNSTAKHVKFHGKTTLKFYGKTTLNSTAEVKLAAEVKLTAEVKLIPAEVCGTHEQNYYEKSIFRKSQYVLFQMWGGIQRTAEILFELWKR